jgi:hypothetical protein
MMLKFITMMRFMYTSKSESYAGGSVAAGRATHVGQVKDKESYPGPPGSGFSGRLTTCVT